MNKKVFVALFVGLLSIGVGCGADDDPSGKNNTKNNVKKNNKTTSNNKSTSGNNGTSTGNNGTSTGNNGTSTGNNGTSTGNNGTTSNVVCDGTNITYYGQIGSKKPHGGGTPVATAVTADAGLDAIWSYFGNPTDTPTDVIDKESGKKTGDKYTLATPFEITNAIVSATNSKGKKGDYGNMTFYVEDGNRVLYVRLEAPIKNGADDVNIVVGEEVSFKVTELVNYGGTPQISGVSDFTKGAAGKGVVVLEKTGQDVTESELYRNVRIQGTLGATSKSCGGESICFDMTHGDKTITFRTTSKFTKGGDCITYVGPLSSYPGPFKGADSIKLQLDAQNWDWARGPFRE